MKKEEAVKRPPSVSDQIWAEIRGVEAPMYALPAKTVETFCTRLDVEPSKVYLKLNAPALLPMLEQLFANKYDIQMGKMYCEISRKEE